MVIAKHARDICTPDTSRVEKKIIYSHDYDVMIGVLPIKVSTYAEFTAVHWFGLVFVLKSAQNLKK